MIQIKKTILTLVALLAVTTGAWAETGENIFQYCYDCQRNPAYPKTTASASLSGFDNPLVGYKGSGFEIENTSDGPWKLEYVGIWSTTDKHGIDDVSYYQYTYNCTDVPVYRLYQWNATANEYQHASYGVVCAYAKVSNAVEHTAFFEAADGWGCVLTNSSHSSSMSITFDEDLTTGLTTLIAAASPASSGTPVDDFAWDKAEKTGTFTMPGGNVTLEPEYYPQAALTAAPTAINDVPATTDGAIVKAGTVANIGSTETAQGTVMYYVSPTALDDAALLALAADQWTADVPTAAHLAQGQAYVYYYVRGNDSDTDEENFSDGDILSANALTVTIAAAPTYAVTFAEGTDPNEWTADPNTGVKKGTPVTVTYTGPRKVMGVKAEKKAAEEPVTLATPLTVEAITAGTIMVNTNGTLSTGMKYSVNGGTKTNITSTTTIEGLKAGDKVQFYSNGTSNTAYSNDPEVKISGGTAEVKVYGNIMSLLDEEGFATKTALQNYAFFGLFMKNTTLIDASELLLPAATVAVSCYQQMFEGCTSLTKAPKLPATTLESYCYYSMFQFCTSLTTAPELPATWLGMGCYAQMFSGCTSLTSAYVKAAYINQSDECYNMFYGCTATGATLHTTSGNKASWEGVMGTGKNWSNWSVADDWQE